ncbi:Hep_Hag [compost metagenome]
MRRKSRLNVFTSVLSLITLATAPFTLKAQTPEKLVDIKDQSQNVKMTVYANGSLVLPTSYTGTDNIPIEGAGTRLLWYPGKSAFRAGSVSGTQWDDANIGHYSVAMGQNVRASGDNAVAFGIGTTAAQFSSVAMGENTVASGAASVALGYSAHTNARQGSFVFADRSVAYLPNDPNGNDGIFRAGVNHSSNWRVSGGFRIFSSSNLSTGVTIQSGASVSNWGQSNAVISTSTGAMLTAGGVWQNASDVNRKHLFEKISGEEVLQKIAQLDIQKWSYKAEANHIKHIGPTSQDFHGAFGLGSDQKSIGTVDADGIALAGIKALEQRTVKQNNEIGILKAENQDLKKRLEALERNSGTAMAGFSLPLSIALGIIALGGLYFSRRKTSINTKN